MNNCEKFVRLFDSVEERGLFRARDGSGKNYRAPEPELKPGLYRGCQNSSGSKLKKMLP